MSDHWQHGPPERPHEPRHGQGGSAGGYSAPGELGTGGYGTPAEGYGPPPPFPQAPDPYGPPSPYGVPHQPSFGGPPPPHPAPYPPVNPYYVEPPDRTSAIIALVVSIVFLFVCMNPAGVAGVVFAAVSLNEAQDHARAARHARYAWYGIGAGVALIVLFSVFMAMVIGLGA